MNRIALSLVVVAIVIGSPVVARADGTPRLLAAGSVWEEVNAPGIDGDWHVQLCSGSFGTTAYAVGRLTSGELPQPRFPTDLVGFWAHDAGPGGTDRSWVVPITSAEHAEAVCADPRSVAPRFTVVGGNVVVHPEATGLG
jgi:hypothetical protein